MGINPWFRKAWAILEIREKISHRVVIFQPKIERSGFRGSELLKFFRLTAGRHENRRIKSGLNSCILNFTGFISVFLPNFIIFHLIRHRLYEIFSG